MEVNNNIEVEPLKSLTILERIKYFFTSPNRLFEDYNIKPRWFVKFLIVVVLTVVATLVTKELTFGPQLDMLLQQTPDMTKEEAEIAMAFLNSPVMTGIAIGAAAGTAAIAVFLISGIYYGLIALFGGKTSYMRVVSVYALAYIPYTLGSLVALLFAFYTNNFDSLLQPELMDVLFNRFDLFVIWQVLLLVFGFAKIAEIKLSKSAIIVGIMWTLATGISLIPVFMNRLF